MPCVCPENVYVLRIILPGLVNAVSMHLLVSVRCESRRSEKKLGLTTVYVFFKHGIWLLYYAKDVEF